MADLGIYFEDDLGRYQNVTTHEDFRRQGICATLVYEAGQYAIKNWKLNALAWKLIRNTTLLLSMSQWVLHRWKSLIAYTGIAVIIRIKNYVQKIIPPHDVC